MIRRLIFKFRGCTWSLALNFLADIDGETTIPVKCRLGYSWWSFSGVDYRARSASNNASTLEVGKEQVGTIWQGPYQWDVSFLGTQYVLKLSRKGMHLSCAGRRIAYLRLISYGTLKVSFHEKDRDLIPLLIFLCLQYNS